MSREVIATLKVSEYRKIHETVSRKINEDFDFDVSEKTELSNPSPAPTQVSAITPEVGGKGLLLDEEVNFDEIKEVALDILGKVLSLRVTLVKSKADDTLIKIIKNIEKSAEELKNYQYKTSKPEEKEQSINSEFETKVSEE